MEQTQSDKSVRPTYSADQRVFPSEKLEVLILSDETRIQEFGLLFTILPSAKLEVFNFIRWDPDSRIRATFHNTPKCET